MNPPTTVPLICPNGHTVSANDTICPQCGTVTRREPVPTATAPLLPSVSGYEVLGVLGKGGMGIVYRARQVALNRLVALKMIRDVGLAGPEERARFQAEAEAVARLQHANVIQVHEVGQHQGQPFFSLEYLSGGSLADRLRGTPQPAVASARLIETLAGAIHAAHQQGIVHRDLKPANVLLTEQGEPKVGDFGLAKRLDMPGQTNTGAILGTPCYMAPEQARGQTRRIGPATDVYALGAILYELLTGRPPFVGESAMETIQQVVGQDPVPPSRLQPKVPRDLETICLKCLNKEPSARYASAAELAQDLVRFRKGEPVKARPLGLAGRTWRWARRHPAPAALIAVTLLALVAVGVGVAALIYSASLEAANKQLDVSNKQLDASRKDADSQRVLAERARDEEKTQRELAEKAETRAKAAEAVAVGERKSSQRLQYFADMKLCQQYLEEGQIDRLRQTLHEHRPGQPGRLDLAGFEYYYLNRLAHQESRILRGHTWPNGRLAFVGPEGRRLASTCTSENGIRVWDLATVKETTLLQDGRCSDPAFRPDGKRLAGGCTDSKVRVWDAATGRELHSWKAAAGGLIWSPDGKRLAGSIYQKGVAIWDAESGKEERLLPVPKNQGISLAWSPDGKRLAGATQATTTIVWDLDSGKEAFSLAHPGAVLAVSWDPDSERLATACWDQKVRVWDARTGLSLLTLEGHTGPVNSVAWSPDGKQLVSASQDHTLILWDAEKGGEPAVTLKAHMAAVYAVAWSPDGKTIASASGDRTVRLWDARQKPNNLMLRKDLMQIEHLAWRPDGKRVASITQTGTLRFWDPETGAESRDIDDEMFFPQIVAYSPNGKLLAGVSATGVRLWEVKTGKTYRTMPTMPAPANQAAFSSDSRFLALAGILSVDILDIEVGEKVRSLRSPQGGFKAVAWSPDGKRLAAAEVQGTIRLFDRDSGREIKTFSAGDEQIWALAWSPDGKYLAAGCVDRMVRLWEVSGDPRPRVLGGHTGAVLSVAFTPDGKRLASGDSDGVLRIWDPESGREALSLKGHVWEVFAVAFSPDGRRLASAGKDASVRIWNAAPRVR